MNENPIRFDCQGVSLIGILHRPKIPARRGVVIVVGGGPQYRVGGHRQLVLWSRTLAAEGIAVFRFDYRGMGDSYGEFRGYSDIDEDIRCAVDCFSAEMPGLNEVVLWGECDAATAILAYAYRDARIRGLVLLNPYARTEAGQARTVLRHYYLNRLMQASFWRKVLTLRFDPFASLRSVRDLLHRARKASPVTAASATGGLAAAVPKDLPLPERILIGFTRFSGPVMLVMSGRDLYAREFDDIVASTSLWQQLFVAKNARRHDLPDADHTFSSSAWRNQVGLWASHWLRSW